MFERAVYSEENDEWYQQGNEPWRILFLGGGERVPPRPHVKAANYPEAFEALFGHPYVIPAPARAPRRRPDFEVVS